MAVSPAKLWQAGAKRLQFSRRNSAGYPVGTQADPETITANTTMSAYVIHGLREFVPAKRDVAKAVNRGDGKIIATMYMGVKDYGEGSFELGVEDDTVDALVKRSTLDTTLASDMLVRAGNEGQAEPIPGYLMSTVRVQDIDDGSFWYKTWIYNNAQVIEDEAAPINQKDGENPSPLKYKFSPSLSNRLVTGHLFSDTDLQVLEDKDTYTIIRSRYPLALTSWKANGSATTFNLPYLPVYSGATGAAQNIITKNGATQSVTSVNTSTGLVTVSAAGSSGDIWVVLYQTNFTAA